MTDERRPPEAEEGGAILEVRALRKRFGGVAAVDDCSFRVPRGSVTGLIGPNGSGKTTVFNLITGMLRPDGGEILLEGRRIDGLPPWERTWRGLGRTFQIARLFREMTVLENVVVPLRDFRLRRMAESAVAGEERRRAGELLERVGLARFCDELAGRLSYGQQKLLELAQALVLRPRLVLLDEPASGVNPRMIERMAELIREFHREGTDFLVVEHNMPLVMDLCDHVLVLAGGRVIARGSPLAVRSDPAVLEAYLGG
ncbi:MAG: ABC transporter ATP-binding protein [Bacillota bacterium]|nr:ABC transporter ATP-binding protein [Bacillota bacterium]